MPPPTPPKPRILLADDEADVLWILKEALTSEGFDVDTAKNGEEAVARIRARPPDIAVLDYMMPVKDGFAVCQEIRQDPLLSYLPMIILSATTDKTLKVQGLNLGADDFISKPVQIEELLARIRMIMRRTREGLDANPLTHLPGNVTIERRIEDALGRGKPLAVLYVDLNQFKAYNDAYGYEAGDHVIKATAQVLIRASREVDEGHDFVGHIGGDDFIMITEPPRMEILAKRVISLFAEVAPSFYHEEDRRRGRIHSTDRQGRKREFPLLSIAVGICHNRDRQLLSHAQVSQIGSELKKHAKEKKGSAYVVDRRRD